MLAVCRFVPRGLWIVWSEAANRGQAWIVLASLEPDMWEL